MLTPFKTRLVILLRWSEKYTKTDMVYLAQSSFWLNLNFIFVSFFSFLLSIAFANLLTKNEYGTYQYILSISTILAAFTYSGFNTAITQSVARGFEGTLRASIRPQLLWNLVPAAAALIWSGYYFVHAQPALGFGLLAICLTLPLINTFNSYGAYLNGKRAFKELSLYLILGNTAYYICIFAGTFLFPQAVPLIIINLVVTTGTSVFFYFKTLRTFKPEGADDPEATLYARHISVMNVIATVAGQIDNLLVFHFLGAVELATYSLATLLPEKLGGTFKLITTSALPRFSERSTQEVRSTIGRRLFFILISTLVAIGFYALIAPLLFHLIYPKYMEAIGYSQWYAFTLVSFVGSLVTSLFFAHKKIRKLYFLNTIVPIVQIIIQIGMILIWGLWGLISAKIISATFTSVVAICLLYFPGSETSISNEK